MSKKEKETVGTDGSYQVKKNKKLNIFAFVACVLASFLIWIYVMNTQNDDYTKTFTLAVKVTNAEDLQRESGLSVYGIPDKSVTVTIRGKKTDVRKYSEKDFRAYLDLSAIEEKGMINLNVSVESPSAALNVVSVDPAGVDVYVDKKLIKIFEPIPKCEEDGKLSLSIASDDPTVEISGPSTYLDKVVYAEVYVPYSDTYGVGDSITTSDIRLYSEDGKELSDLYMTFSKESLVVKVESINE